MQAEPLQTAMARLSHRWGRPGRKAKGNGPMSAQAYTECSVRAHAALGRREGCKALCVGPAGETNWSAKRYVNTAIRTVCTKTMILVPRQRSLIVLAHRPVPTSMNDAVEGDFGTKTKVPNCVGAPPCTYQHERCSGGCWPALGRDSGGGMPACCCRTDRFSVYVAPACCIRP